jgi:CheY-like chemotaxis protein
VVAFPRSKAEVEHKDARILVIDDEPMMADSLKQNLIEEGYTVDTAATGAEAIELLIAAATSSPFAICSCRTWTASPCCDT